MDADTEIDPDFIANAEAYVDRGFAAVGGTFRGQEGAASWVCCSATSTPATAATCAGDTARRWSWTGTATLFSVAALRDVLASRAAGVLPARRTSCTTRTR